MSDKTIMPELINKSWISYDKIVQLKHRSDQLNVSKTIIAQLTETKTIN